MTFYGGNDDGEDNDDSNYIEFHLGFAGGGRGARPHTTRFAGPDEPRLGPGHGPPFRAQQSSATVLMGDVQCPILQTRGAMPCHAAVSGYSATPGTHVATPLESGVDFATLQDSSPSSVTVAAHDPMVDEAALVTPRSCHMFCDSRAVHSIDIVPHRTGSSHDDGRGFVGEALKFSDDTPRPHPSWAS